MECSLQKFLLSFNCVRYLKLNLLDIFIRRPTHGPKKEFLYCLSERNDSHLFKQVIMCTTEPKRNLYKILPFVDILKSAVCFVLCWQWRVNVFINIGIAFVEYTVTLYFLHQPSHGHNRYILILWTKLRKKTISYPASGLFSWCE